MGLVVGDAPAAAVEKELAGEEEKRSIRMVQDDTDDTGSERGKWSEKAWER